jgi:hypothetical protein
VSAATTTPSTPTTGEGGFQSATMAGLGLLTAGLGLMGSWTLRRLRWRRRWR